MVDTLLVDFECVSLPEPDSFATGCRRLGIQDGKVVTQDVLIEGQATIHFQFTIQVAIDPANDTPNFKGSYIQGPRAAHFIYLCWGDRHEGGWVMHSRAKIPLAGLPVEKIQQAVRAGTPLRARIRMSDSRGKPAVATLKPGQVEWL